MTGLWTSHVEPDTRSGQIEVFFLLFVIFFGTCAFCFHIEGESGDQVVTRVTDLLLRVIGVEHIFGTLEALCQRVEAE